MAVMLISVRLHMCIHTLIMDREEEADVISVVVAFVVILAVVTVSDLIYTIYVSQKYSVSTGKGVAGVSVSFSNSYNKNTEVGLSNGYTAKVKWDGKAVGTAAIAGEYKNSWH